jgi:cytochrome P450
MLQTNDICAHPRFLQTVSALYTFYLAMTLFPDSQLKAQDEINRVVGNDRLPNLADRDSLPYVNALVSEVFRWRPVIPTGLS